MRREERLKKERKKEQKRNKGKIRMEIGGKGKVMRMEGERLQSVVWRVILLPLSSLSLTFFLSLSLSPIAFLLFLWYPFFSAVFLSLSIFVPPYSSTVAFDAHNVGSVCVCVCVFVCVFCLNPSNTEGLWIIGTFSTQI